MQLLNVSTVNNMLKKISYVLLLCMTITLLGGCQTGNEGNKQNNNNADGQNGQELTEIVDYAASVELDKASATVKQEVTVKTFVDGDTVHFHVPTSVMQNGVLKARFLSVNTPESTGKIEEWGKKASKFTVQSTAASPWDSDSSAPVRLLFPSRCCIGLHTPGTSLFSRKARLLREYRLSSPQSPRHNSLYFYSPSATVPRRGQAQSGLFSRYPVPNRDATPSDG